MYNTIKSFALLILFISTSSLATTCPPEDSECQTEQTQLQAIKNSGAKPFKAQEITEAPPPADKKNTDYQTVDQPFKIPLPATSQQKEILNSQNQQPQEKSDSSANIFIPNTNTQQQEQQQFKYQPPNSPLKPVPVPQQPVVIEYR